MIYIYNLDGKLFLRHYFSEEISKIRDPVIEVRDASFLSRVIQFNSHMLKSWYGISPERNPIDRIRWKFNRKLLNGRSKAARFHLRSRFLPGKPVRRKFREVAPGSPSIASDRSGIKEKNRSRAVNLIGIENVIIRYRNIHRNRNTAIQIPQNYDIV